MNRTVANAQRLFMTPGMPEAYLQWCWSQMLCRRSPCVLVAPGVRLGHFSSFGEYWRNRGGIANEDVRLIEAALRTLNHREIAIDIGANLGFFTLHFASLGFQRVIAFEPSPETSARL